MTSGVLGPGLTRLIAGWLVEREARGATLAMGGGLAVAASHLLSRRRCRPRRRQPSATGVAGLRGFFDSEQIAVDSKGDSG